MRGMPLIPDRPPPGLSQPTQPLAPDWFERGALDGNTLRLLPTGRFTDAARYDLLRGATRSSYVSACDLAGPAVDAAYVKRELAEIPDATEVVARLLVDRLW